MKNPEHCLETVCVCMLNLATFLPAVLRPVGHDDDEEAIDEVYSSRLDLADMPLQNAELELFMDGSSIVQEVKHKSRSAITP